MKRYFLHGSLLLLLIATGSGLWAQIPNGYYNNANGKTGDELKTALHEIITNHQTVSYAGLLNAFAYTDCDANGKIWDIYSNYHYELTDNGEEFTQEGQGWNREHTWPQSWFNEQTTPRSDLFHVYPTDGYVNNVRGNYAFGEVSSASYTHDGCKFGSNKSISIAHTMLGDNEVSTSCGNNQRVFEPADQYKGDFARGYLGALLRWSGDYQAFTQEDGRKIFSGQYTVSGHFGLTEYGIALLLKWHRQDPVSRKEIDRNNGIQSQQGNRNPFIDYPYLAEFIWGEKAGETVYLNQLMASTDPDFVPGQSNGWRGGEPIIDPEQGMEETGVQQSVVKVQKMLINGQLFIQVGEYIYDVTGKKIN